MCNFYMCKLVMLNFYMYEILMFNFYMCELFMFTLVHYEAQGVAHPSYHEL